MRHSPSRGGKHDSGSTDARSKEEETRRNQTHADHVQGTTAAGKLFSTPTACMMCSEMCDLARKISYDLPSLFFSPKNIIAISFQEHGIQFSQGLRNEASTWKSAVKASVISFILSSMHFVAGISLSKS